MYEFAYNEIVEESPNVMRARERQAFDRVIEMLRAGREKGSGSREAIEALYQLKCLWSVLLDDLKRPENLLPKELRAGLISIGIWVMKEVSRSGPDASIDLTALIEINEIIREGLA
jgi:flagellar protein FlaF